MYILMLKWQWDLISNIVLVIYLRLYNMISTKEPETQMTIPISLLAIISISVLFVVKLLTIELLVSDDVNLSAIIGGIIICTCHSWCQTLITYFDNIIDLD